MGEKKEKLTWNTIPKELQSYFAPRFFISILAMLIFAILLIVGRQKEFWAVLAVISLVSFLYFYYLYIQVKRQKILIYEGICESVNIRVKEFNRISRWTHKPVNVLTVYGNSHIVITIRDKKFIIPVNANFVCSEGNLIRVYTLDTDIYEKGENAFLINRPMLVYVAKM